MRKNRISEIEITALPAKKSQAAYSLVTEVFVNASVLHKATKVTLRDYQEYLRNAFNFMLKQGLSVVAVEKSSNTPVGCVVACDYALRNQTSSEVPKSLAPINALVDSLEITYREQRKIVPGETLLIDMAVVKPLWCGQGIYARLRETAHQLGRESGYRRVVGELTSAATQHLCTQRLGHNIMAEIEYAAFEWQGQRPFASITEPRSIMLVEGEL